MPQKITLTITDDAPKNWPSLIFTAGWLTVFSPGQLPWLDGLSIEKTKE